MVTGGQPGREEASAQQSLQHKTTCLPTLASCLPPYATPSCSCSLEEKKVVNWGSQIACDFFFSATSLSRDVNMNMPEGHPARPHPVRK